MGLRRLTESAAGRGDEEYVEGRTPIEGMLCGMYGAASGHQVHIVRTERDAVHVACCSLDAAFGVAGGGEPAPPPARVPG